ncbi:hypothetical protein CLAFUW4_01635 [Fulvia fulva]|uniref:Uncharacterized protein n=1 Tax=Passalora fulva TaxID=5499 RepID=A0A9Q8P4B9_PASFU|nr:uncharacterized protein CLAFUR5_01634 [Fulvia fulva]KAK4634553.1 hypothetical protein CLAFUR4_01633 [Fulvia fulva]KAK4638394.1 hypothetical protein CLAFUR0_01634 [Fulvia fulva]UJO12808.1 hypothetical protein CLAFUR5_01634 [Fulvia fulva]WPV09483.1 hypothetical protein CLAFUW4_01635 [Fulvia fulva]WPV24953.1 hypothetical protein CLAFUW7_01637 [Fulvia fulva]
MHHLHPRSKATGTLFTTTLAISFLVVAAPHLLPCPVDRRQFADSFETADGRRYRRKRKDNQEAATGPGEAEAADDAIDGNVRPKRECPVPKPGGIVGQIMGFKQEERQKPAKIIVQSLDSKGSQRPELERSKP